uniref:C-type lectin domain-containing protein n=1 Tax=Mastacembelus armatus TaxID=205130 RepID=A0A3Q3M5H6_9TELE
QASFIRITIVELTLMSLAGNATGITERFVLEKVSMDWLSAQLHCRNMYTDLARVRNEAENLQLQWTAQKNPAWIGLTGKSWMWSDGSEAFFIPWQLNQPNFEGIGDCAALQVNSGSPGLTDVDCMTKHLVAVAVQTRGEQLGINPTCSPLSCTYK